MSAFVCKRLVSVALTFVAALFGQGALAYATPAAGETAAPPGPYLYVDGGDSGIDRLPLKKTSAAIRLNGFIASVEVSQVYRNEGSRPINATYIFPGSTHAAVNGMTMTIGERRIVAQIREKEEAKQVFDAARLAGKSASLLSQKRPNVFSMAVANIMPGEEVTVSLSYTEIVTAEDGVYEFVFPGVVGPRYAGDAARASAERHRKRQTCHRYTAQDEYNFDT